MKQLGFSALVITSVFASSSLAANSIEPASSGILPSQPSQTIAMPLDAAPRSEPLILAKRSHSPKPGIFTPSKPLPTSDPEVESLMAEIKSMPWEAQPNQLPGINPNSQQGEPKHKRIGLEKIFKEALENSLSIQQAEAKVDAPASPTGDGKDPNMLNWILPQNTNSLKEAYRLNTEAAKAHVQAMKQKALLDSAKLYSDLTKAYLERYLAGQAIAQGLRQLDTEEKRFQGGETNHFDVTRTELTVIDRYNKFLTADTAYRSLSAAVCSLLGYKPENLHLVLWIPEDFNWKDGQPDVPLLHLYPEGLTIEGAHRAANLRPDIREADLRLEALGRLVKIAFGPEKEKRKADQKQLEFERDKGVQGVNVAIEKAFNEARQAQKAADLAQQQANLTNRSAQQIQVSYKAGFSSAKEVSDAETELMRVQTALMGTRVAANFSRIQFVYEMGLLTDSILSRPIEDSL